MSTLVLVHGLGVTGRSVEPLLAELPDLEWVVPDLRANETIAGRETVGGAGHAVHHSHPRKLATLVRGFLEEPA